MELASIIKISPTETRKERRNWEDFRNPTRSLKNIRSHIYRMLLEVICAIIAICKDFVVPTVKAE